MRRKKTSFTLIEILVVIFILSLVSSIIGVNIRKALREQNFKSEVALVADQIQFAQNLMLIMQKDVHVKIAPGRDKQLNMWIEVENEEQTQWIEEAKNKPKILKTVQYIGFIDRASDSVELESTKGIIDLQFLSKGFVVSQGVVHLRTSAKIHKSVLERYISLYEHLQPPQIEYNKPIQTTDFFPYKKQLIDLTKAEIKGYIEQQQLGNVNHEKD